jgi:hypothetical protein
MIISSAAAVQYGATPVKLFPSNDTRPAFVQFRTATGMVPDNRFPSRYTNFTLVNDPIAVGNVPEKSLWSKSNNSRLLQSPICSGRVPPNSFRLAENTVKEPDQAGNSSVGIDPVNML